MEQIFQVKDHPEILNLFCFSQILADLLIIATTFSYQMKFQASAVFCFNVPVQIE